RTPELTDDEWLRVVDDAIEAGVLEAVVTGGEPFLRRDLAFEVLERLDAAGVAIYLNTNGWFVDDDVADRMARLAGLHVFISIDGATAERHDAARGVPGSWRRAVLATSRLLERGVPARAVQVVTPENHHEVERSLDLFWELGVPAVHLAPVSLIGAAARGGDWLVDRYGVAAVVERARERYEPAMSIQLRGGDSDGFDPLLAAPATFLVRPDGVVRISSSVPFSFGHVRDGLTPAWQQIRERWDGPEVRGWIDAVRRRSELNKAAVVPYLDEDAPIAPAVEPTPGGRGADRLRPAPVRATVEDAEAFVRDLALGRRYRLGEVRWTDAGDGGRFVHCRPTETMTRLNATAAVVMGAATPGEALETLKARHPSVGEDRLRHDVLRAVRMLLARSILVPEAAVDARPRGAAEPAAALTA
ncbi:MAG TPA: radical SAM protein, partial [Solirubrobacteraceae bacterium]